MQTPPAGLPVGAPADDDGEGYTGRVLRGMRTVGIGYVVNRALGIALALALARLLTPTDFGLVAEASIVAGFTALFAQSGMAAALIQRRERVEEAANTALVATVAGGAALSLLSLACAPLLGLIFRSPEVTALAAALSGQVFFRALAVVPDALMQRRFRFLRGAVIDPAGLAVSGIASISLAVAGFGPWALVAGSYASVVLSAALTWALARWRPRLRLASRALWRELAGYGRHVVASEVVLRSKTVGETAIVGRFLSTASVGQYGYAILVAMQPVSLLIAIAAHVLFPAFSRISDDPERLSRAYLRSLRWISVAVWPVSLALIPLGGPLVALLLGSRWEAAGQAVGALALFPIGHAYVSLASEAWKACGRTERLPRLHLVASGAWIVLMLAGLPFGLVGVAVGISAASLIAGAYALWSIERTLSISLRASLLQIGPPAAAAALMAGALMGVEHVVGSARHGTAPGIALLVAEALAGLLVYGAALALIAPGHVRPLRERGALALRRALGGRRVEVPPVKGESAPADVI